MIRCIPSVVLLVLFFTTPVIHSQEISFDRSIHSDSVQNHQDHLETKRDTKIFHIACSDHMDHSDCPEFNHEHSSNLIVLSLDEIISSDDIIDFNCTGGFCMKKSHKHKKGLSTQRQLFDYFMRISA